MRLSKIAMAEANKVKTLTQIFLTVLIQVKHCPV